jgi:hypothetical protein
MKVIKHNIQFSENKILTLGAVHRGGILYTNMEKSWEVQAFMKIGSKNN